MRSLDDYQRYDERLQRELDHLDEGPYTEADQRAVKRWVTKVDGDVGQGTLSTYLRNLRKTAERLDMPIVELDEADMDAHVYDLRHNPAYGRGSDSGLADSTIRNVEFVVRKIHRDLDLSEWVEDYSLTPPADNTVQPEDMLQTDDIRALCEGAINLRDVAIIEFLADTACRISMLGSLRVKDVSLDGRRATYTPNREASALKDAPIREYPIIDSKAPLRSYLRNTHPRPDEPDAPFFHRLAGHGYELTDNDGTVSPETIRRQLRSAADRAGVDKPVNPHNFRHSAITRMRREGYSRSEIEHRVHWSVDTDMWSTYEHISAEEHNEAIWEKAGVVDADEDSPDQRRRRCGNCTETLAPHHEYCPQCGEAVGKQARELRDEATSSIADGMVEVGDMSRREFRAFVLEQIQDDPSTLGTHESPSSSDSSSSGS